MIQVIQAIALICQLSSGREVFHMRKVERIQIKCQKELLRCVRPFDDGIFGTDYGIKLRKCVLKRKENL